jgi:DNA-directed RNA polymerase specialized sigma24 family protein
MHPEPSLEPLRRHLPSLTRWTQLRLPSSSVQVSSREWLEEQARKALQRLDQTDSAGDQTPNAHIREALLESVREVSAESHPDGTATPPGREGGTEGGSSTLEAAIGRQALLHYERALQKLDGLEREAVIARIELGFSYQAIASALGSESARAARLVVRQALVRLALLMNDNEL